MDVPFLMDLVRECKTSSAEIALPRYDKSQHNGRGDRALPIEWDRKQGTEHKRNVLLVVLDVDSSNIVGFGVHVLGPLDVLLIEGWSMGFQAIDDASPELSEHMKAVNKELRAFDKFYEELDGLVVIKIDNLDWVYQYVTQQIPQWYHLV
ncbi:unnamed protein product [Phytophthora fragariaefolia]|uniref:Unnamed protein product n=1 Tax=Phytophthora fragariaefolia TaxID=1490495 RepID=A0A9W6U4L6_9STRA|nr:unnamed protein product [Phytophthora fragariaefolia]